MRKPRKVVLLSGHHLLSDRRAGFHHLAFAYRELGWRVTFITTGMSAVSYLRHDHRRKTFRLRDRNRLFRNPDGIEGFVWLTPWHPASTRTSLTDAVTRPLFRAYGGLRFPQLQGLVEDATLIIVESSYGLFLVERLRRLAPQAKLVYRQSDDLDALTAHPALHDAEARALRMFDVISVPDDSRPPRFRGDQRVRVQRHGIDTSLFDDPGPSPYPSAPFATNAVFVGIDALDVHSLQVAARRLPDWGFHVIGPWAWRGWPANVVAHGEMPFAETVPFVAHADVGLHTTVRPHGEYFRESLKFLQYTYSRLPIVAEEGVAADRPHVFPYSSRRPESIVAACRSARDFPREAISREGIHSWKELALDIAEAGSRPSDDRLAAPPELAPRGLGADD
jgi:2-beta-glucuronyltransferase